MEDAITGAPSTWLAQASSTPSTMENLPPAAETSPTGEMIEGTSAVDYESGEIAPQDEMTSAADKPEDVTGSAVGAKEASTDQGLMEGGSTPPPPAYGDGGTANQVPTPETQLESDSGIVNEVQAAGGAPVEEQAITQEVPKSSVTDMDPPLGLLPFIVFGVGAIAALIIFFSRRQKNWGEIGDAIHSEVPSTSLPESRIATQFSEIKDLGDYQTQHSHQVSSFE